MFFAKQGMTKGGPMATLIDLGTLPNDDSLAN